MAELIPDTAIAVEFLKHRGVNVVLSAKHVEAKGDGGRFETRAFPEPTDWEAVANWINARQGKANLYYAVNPSTAIDKKTSRANILALSYLHIDCDARPVPNERKADAPAFVAEEVGRIIKTLEAYDPPPTYIVASGGGAQAFWKLSPAIPVNGDLTICEDLKLYNLKLEQDLEGDHCHSLDHIMRLPGTINVPNESKRVIKSRGLALATWFKRSEAVYDIGRFKKARVAKADAAPVAFAASGSYEKVRADDPRLTALTPAMIKLGVEGDTENKYLATDGKTDRSKMALAFVTSCARAEVPPEVCAAILMDPTWKVGECIRDKGGEVQRQLKRIIERGYKFAEEDLEKPPVLSTGDWEKAADLFILRVWPNLVYWNGFFYLYEPLTGVYVQKEESAVRAAVRRFLTSAKKASKQDDGSFAMTPYRPTTNDVSELTNALKDYRHHDRDTLQTPAWIEPREERPLPSELVVCQNGLLHVPSRRMFDHSPDLFALNAVSFPYDPDATCPVWLATLKQWWPDNEDGTPAVEILLLQEILGYLLLPDNRLQKMFAFLGPTRSGKGTIATVIEHLVGLSNCAGPSLDSLSGDFGLWPLIDKTVAIISETGFGKNSDRVGVTRTLKAISGNDRLDINRKNSSFWQGRLLARICIFSNSTPEFADDSRALAARIVPLRMQISFEKRENEGLGATLLTELPGIFAWALKGYDRLWGENKGKFTMPETSVEAREDFSRMSSPLPLFLEDSCEVTGNHATDFVHEDDIFLVYEKWCERSHQRTMVKSRFIDALIAATGMSKVKKAKKSVGTRESRDRFRVLTGLKLKVRVPKDNRGEDISSTKKGAPQGDIPF